MELADTDHSTKQMPAERIANSLSVVKGYVCESILCEKIFQRKIETKTLKVYIIFR